MAFECLEIDACILELIVNSNHSVHFNGVKINVFVLRTRIYKLILQELLATHLALPTRVLLQLVLAAVLAL